MNNALVCFYVCVWNCIVCVHHGYAPVLYFAYDAHTYTCTRKLFLQLLISKNKINDDDFLSQTIDDARKKFEDSEAKASARHDKDLAEIASLSQALRVMKTKLSQLREEKDASAAAFAEARNELIMQLNASQTTRRELETSLSVS